MLKNSATSPSLPKSRVRTEANEVRQSELELDDVSAERAKRREEKLRTDSAEALRIFSGAVERWEGKEANFATEMHVVKSILSEIKNGKRILKGADFLTVLDPEQPEATDWVMQQLAAKAGGTYRRNRKATKAQAEKAVARAAKRSEDLWEVIKKRAAAEAGTDVADLEAALDEAEAVSK